MLQYKNCKRKDNKLHCKSTHEFWDYDSLKKPIHTRKTEDKEIFNLRVKSLA